MEELVGSDRVLGHLRFAERGLVDARGDPVDEPPLEHAASDGGDGVLRVGIEVEAESLAVLAVAGLPQLERWSVPCDHGAGNLARR